MRRSRAALLVLLSLVRPPAAGSPATNPPAETSPAPGVPWPLPEGKGAGSLPAAPAPPFAGRAASLPEAVDFALDRSPATRAAWRRARAAAAAKGVREAAWWPTLDVDVNFSRTQSAAAGGQITYILSSWGPAATLSWLLLDLGGRSADVAEARSVLEAANLSQDASIQETVLAVEAAFFFVGASRELVSATETSLHEAEQSLAAAEARHASGLATIADVLQARTARSQADLALVSARGRLETARGVLASTLGLPANFPVDTAPLPADLGGLEDRGPDGRKAEALIEAALAARPDVLAARSAAEAAAARVRSVRSAIYPRLTGIATLGRPYYLDSAYASFNDTWSVGLNLHVPVFSGFSRVRDLARAKEEAEATRAEAEGVANRAALDAWTAYWELKTARQRLASTRDLLEAAAASSDVAAGRYREGVGTFLDLLTAQSALASARAQEVSARADGLVAIARLAWATGSLGPAPNTTAPGSPR